MHLTPSPCLKLEPKKVTYNHHLRWSLSCECGPWIAHLISNMSTEMTPMSAPPHPHAHTMCVLRWAMCLPHNFTWGLSVNFHVMRWQAYFWCPQMLTSMVGPPIYGLVHSWGAFHVKYEFFSQWYSKVHPLYMWPLIYLPIKTHFMI